MGIRAAWAALWGQKASEAGALVSMGVAGRPAWTPRNYKKLAEEGYQQNVIAYRCISEIARGAASVPLKLMRGDEEVETHPVLSLLARPNPVQGQFEFFEALHAYGQIAGDAFVEAVQVNGRPGELWLHRPDRMKIVPGRAGLPQAYEFKVGSKTVRWEVDPVNGVSPILHVRRFNPLNDWYGMSPIDPAARSIDQHNEAGAWNKSLLQRGARPSGALVFKAGAGANVDMTLDDGQKMALKEMMAEFHEGGHNAGRTLLLEGGLDWREMSMSPKDMDWLEGTHNSARDIANAFGCPPQILSLPGDSTFSNMREARLWMWEQTILPVLGSVATELNRWLLPAFEDTAEMRLVPDVDEIPAMAPRRERAWERAMSAVGVLTTNEIREIIGYGAIEGGDDVLIDAGKVPLTFEGAEEAEPGDEDAEKLARLGYGDPKPARLTAV